MEQSETDVSRRTAKENALRARDVSAGAQALFRVRIY